MKTPILGSTYVARSLNAAAARMVNLFPEIVPEAGKEPAFLNRAPGLEKVVTVGGGPIRGLWALGDYFYAVSGGSFYRIDSSFNAELIGMVTGTGTVSMADNGTQIFVACNPNGYIYDTTNNQIQRIGDEDFPGAVTVTYLDGYFVFNEPNSQRLWVTDILNGASIDPLGFASAESSPDNVVGVIGDHREIWVFGTNSVEVWYDAGDPDFPLQRIQGAFNEIGCAAPYSIAKMDNGIFWLGQDARGQGMVYRSQGYSGQRVSTHAVEWQIQQYADLSSAIAYAYQQDGHSFYVLSFPGENTSWVYDASTQAWHERAGFENGEFVRHRGNCAVFFKNNNLVGDYLTGDIYRLSLDVFTDGEGVQKWLRSWRALPTGKNDLRRSAHHSLQLDMETGTGLQYGQGQFPEVILRWSDDGGHTWTKEYPLQVGKVGQFGTRVIWRRLGMTTKLRDRVYEVSGTDPVKIVILGAELMESGARS